MPQPPLPPARRDQLIDRRLSGKNKSVGNRERFLRRYRDQIREAVRQAVGQRGLHDIDQAADIALPRRDVSEPQFQHGPGGLRELVHPGNHDYLRGDRLPRPPTQGGAPGTGEGAPEGLGEDDFHFRITREEFMDYFFEDLALPRILRTELLADTPEWRWRPAGFVSEGNPTRLHVVRSMRVALGRRLAMGARRQPGPRPARIPFLDPMDLRYRHRVREPRPTSKAVMFCLMDVSGSMDETRKDLAKRFFILLYLFLSRHYQQTEVVFIRHHTQASEVTETEFFRAAESGGTVVSSALALMHQIVCARYLGAGWSIYGAQASDGDNWQQDSSKCRALLAGQLLPLVRYFAYVQVALEDQNLWEEYATVQRTHAHFAMQKITEPGQILPVFRDLFRKDAAVAV